MDSIEQRIIDMYNSGDSIDKIRKHFHKRSTFIKNVLLNNNIILRTHSEIIQRNRESGKWEICSIIKEKIIKEYEKGATLVELSKLYKIDRDKIALFLKKDSKVRYRTKQQSINNRTRKLLEKNGLNHKAFELNIEESLYWLGFIATDGNINRNLRNITIELQYNDIKTLEKFKTFLNSKRKITIIKRFEDNPNKKKRNSILASFTVCSPELVKHCLNCGIIPNKSLTLKILNEELLKSKDFWRGCIDGDGTVRISKHKKYCYPQIGLFSASKNFIQQFFDFCKSILPNFKNKINKKNTEKNNMYNLVFNGKNALLLITYLYQDSKVYLDRKYIKSLEIMEEYNNKYKY